jgi:spoIIIJ-associated protein
MVESSSNKQQQGQEWLEELLEFVGLSANVKSTFQESEFGASYWLTIDATYLTPKQVKALTGSRGEALDAIQYMANSILNLGCAPEEQAAYTVELDGYRRRRLEELKRIASEAVETVRQTGQEQELKELSAAERRQVHNLLAHDTDLETYSRGQEPNRSLVIRSRS